MENFNYEQRFSRLKLLLGSDILNKLKNSTVMVLGVGGVGSSCALALARGGIGHLILIDGDRVEESNINRQALAFTSTIGKVKVEVMAQMVEEINPDCQVEVGQIFLTKDNLLSTLSAYPRPDYVIDCIDTITQKMAVAHWCHTEGIPLLASMGAANKYDPTQLAFAPIEATTNCPMSKVIRRECRQQGIKQLEVLYSKELPIQIQHDASQKKAETLGTMSYMPPIMGQMLAGKVIQRLAGIEKLGKGK